MLYINDVYAKLILELHVDTVPAINCFGLKGHVTRKRHIGTHTKEKPLV